MGVDYDSKLIFGTDVDAEEIQKIEAKLFEDTGVEYDLRQMSDNCEEMPFEGIYLLSCSPYFDCSDEDRLWFFSVNTEGFISATDINSVTTRFYALMMFLDKYGITGKKLGVFSSPNVW